MDIINNEELAKSLCDEKSDFHLDKPEDFLDTVKSFAKEYFPWRIRGNEIVPIYNGDVS